MESAPRLRRGISLWLLTLYGLGNILGAGIYVLIGKVAGVAGMFAPLSFLVSAFVAGLTAFSYRELATRYPLSAGEAVYVQEGFGQPWLSRLVGLLIVVMGAVSSATLCRGFVGYLEVFIPVADSLAIVVLLTVMGGIAIWGVRESVGLAALITLLEIGGLLLILWVAGESFRELPARWPELLPPGEWPVWNGIFLGAVLAFYAFIGFEDMVNVAEEVKDPARNLPLAIVLALLMATSLYMVIALVAVLALPPGELAVSDAPLALLYEQATGRSPVTLGIIGMFAVINGALVQIIMASRVLYGMSRQRWLPSWLGTVAPGTRTPVRATVLAVAIVMALALWLPLLVLAQLTSLLVLLVFALVNLALLRVKRRLPAAPGVRRAPGWVPVAGATTSLLLVGFQVSQWVAR